MHSNMCMEKARDDRRKAKKETDRISAQMRLFFAFLKGTHPLPSPSLM